MFLDDTFHDRETQTGSLPEIFRCEKGVENPRADLFRHPMAVIGYAQAYMTVLSIEAQPEPPPLRHDMETIHHQIDQHLDKLVSVGMDNWYVPLDHLFHRDSAVNDPLLEHLQAIV